MRTLLVAPYLAPEGGGLERYADQTARHLAALGHDVTLLGHSKTPGERMGEDGVRRIGVKPLMRLSNAPVGMRLLRATRRLLKTERHEVVNVHTPVPGSAELAALAASVARVPYAVTYHAGRLESQSSIFNVAAAAHRHTFERLMIAGADARIAVSPYVARRVFGGKATFIVPPGVDTTLFRPVAEPEPGRILFVGPVSRAYAWKGLSTLRDAFERLATDRPRAHLRVVGDGDLAEGYRAWARAKGLEDRFEIVGRVSDARLAEEYSRASVVVLPSWTPAESFGMVLAEANACGRPVVGSRVGGIPDFVRDGENGLLADPKFILGLAEAIGRVLDDPQMARQMGERGRARVEREHRWSDLAKRTGLALASAADRSLTAGRSLSNRRTGV